jgi:hypothetical protein
VDAAAYVGDLEATETSESVCSMSSTAIRASIGPIAPWEAPTGRICHVYGERYRTASDTLKMNIAPLGTIYRVRPLSFWTTHTNGIVWFVLRSIEKLHNSKRSNNLSQVSGQCRVLSTSLCSTLPTHYPTYIFSRCTVEKQPCCICISYEICTYPELEHALGAVRQFRSQNRCLPNRMVRF